MVFFSPSSLAPHVSHRYKAISYKTVTKVLTACIWKVHRNHQNIKNNGHGIHCYSLPQKITLFSHLGSQFNKHLIHGLMSLHVVTVGTNSPSVWDHHFLCCVLSTEVSGRRSGCKTDMTQDTNVQHPCNKNDNLIYPLGGMTVLM